MLTIALKHPHQIISPECRSIATDGLRRRANRHIVGWVQCVQYGEGAFSLPLTAQYTQRRMHLADVTSGGLLTADVQREFASQHQGVDVRLEPFFPVSKVYP